MAFPPAAFASPNSTQIATIKPYDGPDAQNVIQNVNARQHNNGRGHNSRGSVAHGRGISVSTSFRTNRDNNASANAAVNGNANAAEPTRVSPQGRDQPSPTLPDLPSHPTLNSLISSSLTGVADPTASDPAVVVAQPEHGAPRIGDPGKRMLGAALGVRHPSLPPRTVGGAANGIGDVTRAMNGLVVAE